MKSSLCWLALLVHWQRRFATGLLLEFPLLQRRRGLGRGGRLYRTFFVAVLAVAITGCTTKSTAKAQARAAYVAGQQQALERVLQSRNSVTIIGQVRNPLVPWTEDLTLAKALIAADYYAKGDPRHIVIVRKGQASKVDPKQLLAGEDVPLEAGDVVNIR